MLKEIRLSPNISSHDVEYRVKQANKFLKKGNQVKVSVIYKGREKLHEEIGARVLLEFVSQCDGKLANQAKVTNAGKKLVLSVTLNPKSKQ